MTEKLKKLQERKLALVANMREVNDAPTFDEEKYSIMEADLLAVEKEMERELRLSDFENKLKEVRDTPAVENPAENTQREAKDKAKR